MALAEGSGARFAYKFYTLGTMVSNTEDQAPGATGAQIVRRVSANLNLNKNATRSQEILTSRQVRSYRHTARRLQGSVSGELSPNTYFDWFEAALRGTAVDGVVSIPATGHVRRKLALERYNEDLDIARLYTECRVTGFRVNVPAEGNSTVEFMFMGRNRVTLTGASAPYFTSTTAATSDEVCNSLSGSITLNGTAIGLVTSIQINLDMAADAPSVLGQQFPPDILLGTANVSGNVSFLLDDADTASTLFENETEFAIVATLTNATSGGDSIEFNMPRCKLGSADEDVRGEGSQVVNCQYQALEATSGAIQTTLRITDSTRVPAGP